MTTQKSHLLPNKKTAIKFDYRYKLPQNDEDLSYPKPEIEMSQIKLSTMSKSSRLCLKILG